MPVHRIAKRASAALATEGATAQTIGLVYDTTSTEGKLTWSSDGTNTLFVDDGHMGAAALSAKTSSYGIASQQQSSSGVGNAADATDDVLFTFALPANAFSANGKAVEIEAWGSTANNANTHTIQLWWGTTTQTVGSAVSGGTSILSFAGGQNQKWYLWAQVVRSGSSAQISFASAQAGTTAIAPTLTLNLAATDTSAINITLTGKSSASAASDVLANNFSVCYSN